MARTSSSQSVYRPPWTKTGASCQPSVQPWSSSQSVTSSSRSDVSIGSSCGALATRSAARCLQFDQRFQLGLVVLAAGDHLELAAHPGDPLAQAGGGADRGGGRVVELVGQAGGQRAERQQPLALVDRLLGPLAAEEQPFEQVDRHREPLVHDLGEAVRAEHEEPGPLGDPHRVVVQLRHPVTEVGHERAAVHAALAGPGSPRRRRRRPSATGSPVPSISTYRFAAGSPSVNTWPGSMTSTCPSWHSRPSCSSLSFSNRNSERSSAGSQAEIVVIAFSRLHRFQVPVHEHDGHRALADRRGDPLGRLGPHVAGHEDPGDAGLQVIGRPVQRPVRLVRR